MQLTRRQTTFVERLVDLYHGAHGPFHYSTLARRLGGSRFTAYHLLRLPEEHGRLRSAYPLSRGRSWARWLRALLGAPEGGDRASVSLLGGWALAALDTETQAGETWRGEAFAHLRRYQALVIEMGPALCRRLSQGLREVFAPMLAEPLPPPGQP